MARQLVIAAGVGAGAGIALLAAFRAGAWLLDAAVTAWFGWQERQDGDGHDVWPTDMESES